MSQLLGSSGDTAGSVLESAMYGNFALNLVM